MTKYYLRLLLLVASIIAFFALIGSLLPRGYEFSSKLDITAPANRIFPYLNQLSNWQQWTQWSPAKIPDLTVQYSGNESGVGSTQSWTDPRGAGKLWITASVPDEKIEYEMLFANFPKMSSTLELTEQITDEKTTTLVKWSSSGRLPGGPFYGYFAPFFSTHMRAEYENSLEKLKQLIEQKDVDRIFNPMENKTD